ncbi:hypothetical protein G7Y89_g7734 [Cudoniella acicularis]|uniref:Guanine nucleotide-exchange factor SEC12 n=1 Tax=Cudoniella acicularis TaxID=354080 RepID=A0A8H4W196_9HELO|nr:hypothetical protein G7Y89_g7734 [Cudoniella acicularis]
MAPLISSAKTTLSYPLYACDFDPLDSSRLVVGGGGGAGKSGVGNKITLLDASNASEVEEAGEIDLSRDEDNVTTLAVGQRKGKATLVYAGANSSPQDVQSGKNLHFRIFGIEPATKGKGKSKEGSSEKALGSKISETSRSKLFSSTSEKDTYQRLLRLSKAYPDQPQLGAVATGFAKESEIVLFDTSAISPPNSRGTLKLIKEAVDVDFIQTGKDEYMFAYCDTYDIYLKKISPNTDNEIPAEIYVTPASRGSEKVSLPTFRALRFLTPEFLLMLTNIHSNGGVVLQILRIPPSGKGQCRLSQSHRLPSSISKATGLAVANLTPPLSPTTPQDYTQFVIAVAGQNISISLFKVDLQVENKISMVTPIKPFRKFNNVHPHQITSLNFSNFVPPAHPIKASTPPQYLKLASTGVSNTVVVYTLPLFPVPLSMKRGQSRTPRYVVALPSTKAALGVAVLLCTIGILLGAIFVQGFLEIRGGAPIRFNASNYLPLRIQEALGKPYTFPSGYGGIPTAVPTKQGSGYNHHLGVPTDPSEESSGGSALRLPEIFAQLAPTGGPGVVLLKEHEGEESGIKAELHDEEVHGPHGGKSWEELKHEQKALWLKKLKDAGYWAEDMGETILKGVVFGEIAGAVAQAVGG